MRLSILLHALLHAGRVASLALGAALVVVALFSPAATGPCSGPGQANPGQ